MGQTEGALHTKDHNTIQSAISFCHCSYCFFLIVVYCSADISWKNKWSYTNYRWDAQLPIPLHKPCVQTLLPVIHWYSSTLLHNSQKKTLAAWVSQKQPCLPSYRIKLSGYSPLWSKWWKSSAVDFYYKTKLDLQIQFPLKTEFWF